MIHRDVYNLRVVQLLLGERIWGAERYVLNLIEGLASLGVETVAICAKEVETEQALRTLGCMVHVIPIHGYGDVVSYFRIKDAIDKLEVDLIHAHLGLDSFLASTVGKLTSIPVVMSVHFDSPSYMSSP